MLIESTAVRALNALLDSEPWARARLAPFAGESIEVRAPLAPALRFSIAEGGRLAPAGDAFSPSLVIRLEAAALPAAARGEEALLRAIEIEGNAGLAAEVLHLLRHLRWDVEEGLSVWVGDVAAHRIVATAREIAKLQADAARRLAEGVIEYALEEQPLLVPRAGLEALAAAIGGLHERLDELQARLERLSGER
jgi:ubiquinone biosynthesis accessory factor UbiJ